MPGSPPPRRPAAKSVASKLRGPFNPNARLDPGQVQDMRALDRAPVPMDVVMSQAGRPLEWFPSANAGGISWNPHVWTINPGPMNTGRRA